ncbi:spore dipicolinate synthase subunit B [[Clostridium] ultunense Esp]|uniref:Spore dipicolinate synthase subunit B n=1 Tax=[Clostridium] ultunense Esp TaxID=1288971 RepID=M1ZIA6_9FIRM|nr:dipicolinate synthase subunit B [Schnuerera ultunensis]CCQ93662.1 spore dipicolinate synthase subunit B [[Clostridium] ultunense Esp]SHD78114.1 spore dipicolinate synthase subunit B [[Clostridium] ultunense Esp]
MILKGMKIGWALTGSSCNFEYVFPEIEKLANKGADLYPIISYSVNSFDTRFGTAEEWKNKLRNITGKELIATIVDAEPVGPKLGLDILIVAPCTGNTLSKLANGITDTPVTMACKAHLRNQKLLVLAIATNDGLGANGKNIGLLLNMKNIYFVPFRQDNPKEKPNSLVAKFEKIEPTLIEALSNKQIQPVLE